jgi:hypothetical protein
VVRFDEAVSETELGVSRTVNAQGGLNAGKEVFRAEGLREKADHACRQGSGAHQGIHVMARFDTQLERPVVWSASGLYQAIKAFLAQAAASADRVDTQQLRKTSTHWLRHSYASHALQGREGKGGRRYRSRRCRTTWDMHPSARRRCTSFRARREDECDAGILKRRA